MQSCDAGRGLLKTEMLRRPAIKLATRLLVILLAALGLVSATGYHKPTLAQAARVSLGQGLSGADLERLKIGHQAGVLKVVGPDGADRFAKRRKGMTGIDGREWAPLSPQSRDAVLKALGVSDPSALAARLMSSYSRISRAHALALLGVLAYPGLESAALPAAQREKVLQFLRDRLQPVEDNVVRRQAVLALAIQPATDAQTVSAMLNFLRRDHNAWNTFGVVQFFEYQAGQVRDMDAYPNVLVQLAASGSPLASQIARDLKSPPPESQQQDDAAAESRDDFHTGVAPKGQNSTGL
jgi:hypothetical protein